MSNGQPLHTCKKCHLNKGLEDMSNDMCEECRASLVTMQWTVNCSGCNNWLGFPGESDIRFLCKTCEHNNFGLGLGQIIPQKVDEQKKEVTSGDGQPLHTCKKCMKRFEDMSNIVCEECRASDIRKLWIVKCSGCSLRLGFLRESDIQYLCKYCERNNVSGGDERAESAKRIKLSMPDKDAHAMSVGGGSNNATFGPQEVEEQKKEVASGDGPGTSSDTSDKTFKYSSSSTSSLLLSSPAPTSLLSSSPAATSSFTSASSTAESDGNDTLTETNSDTTEATSSSSTEGTEESTKDESINGNGERTPTNSEFSSSSSSSSSPQPSSLTEETETEESTEDESINGEKKEKEEKGEKYKLPPGARCVRATNYKYPRRKPRAKFGDVPGLSEFFRQNKN